MRNALFVLVFVLTAVPAWADTIGATGPVVVLRIYTTHSDDDGLQDGLLRVGDAVGGYLTYYWGGSRCPSLDLTDAEVTLLHSALDNPRMHLEPRYKVGQGGALCIVAFSLVLRSELGALP